MINWPQTLIKEIAARRCILFLGAGVSSSSQTSDGSKPKGWKDFIADATELINDLDKKEVIIKLIEQGKYLLALQAICSTVDPSEYRHFLDENFNNKSFQASKLHHIILKLDQRLVITTNFDKIYESYCYNLSKDGFKVITCHQCLHIHPDRDKSYRSGKSFKCGHCGWHGDADENGSKMIELVGAAIVNRLGGSRLSCSLSEHLRATESPRLIAVG